MTTQKSNIFIGAALIVFAAVLKAITFPASFNPIIAISLFSGVVISDKRLAFLMPLLAMFFSDIILEVFNIAPGFYGMGQIGNYLSLLLVTVLGFGMKKLNAVNVVGFSLASSLLFFFLSNTNVFFFDTIAYDKTISGYLTCMAAGVPFIKNGLITDLFFSITLFGSYQLLYKGLSKKIVPAS